MKMPILFFETTVISLACLFGQGNGFFAKAQEPAAIDSALNELFFSDPDLYDLFDSNTKYHFLYLSSTYNSSTNYVGREIGDNYSNVNAQLYYFISNGIYFAASGAWYSYVDPGLRTSVLSVGYSNSPKWFKQFYYRASAERIIYLNMGTDFEPDYTSDLNVGFTLRNKWAGIRADYTLLMGKEFANLLSTDVFAKIRLWTFQNYDRIEFEPQISWDFGNETVEIDLNADMIDDPFYEPNYVLKREFGHMNTQITVPITVGYRNFDLDMAYLYNFPVSLDTNYYYDNSGFFRFTLAYIIPIF